MALDLDTLLTWVARALVLFTSMPVHEYAHGWAASKLGDDTPARQGRLTLNPLAHLDLLGSLLLIFAGFGWAKPVQVDPRNFKKPKRDMAITSLAGPLSNVLFALVLLIPFKALYGMLPSLRFSSGGLSISYVLIFLETIIYTNLFLAVFNLIPFPPLDGAKIFGAILPDRFYFTIMRYERYIMVVLFVLLFTGIVSLPLQPLVNGIFWFLDLITFPLGRLAV